MIHKYNYYEVNLGSLFGGQVRIWTWKSLKQPDRKEVEATTVNIDIRTLKAAFEKAVDWGYLEKNPFRRVSLMRVERKQAEFLSRDEFIQLVKLFERKT